MKWAQLLDANGKSTWVNAANVTYIQHNDEKNCVVHFAGAKENSVHIALPADEVASQLR